ncbi:ABC transporter ATP-binding protein [bacterium]|nr:ABC transporter ATP-binding protein [bacterium]NCQ54751.1 ABC transporter ATP-binding protein [Candidatus Parcubacteria bacterium]NCS68004.1 ABC transporter ATP-binding protein [Candidatus Peregrinibacteria bacterium]NCS95741.1 ABC transporter ATP-binding protein [bacterium]
MTLIKLQNVHKSYYLANGEEIPVLRGVDLEIHKNEFVAIMGESGGGKSTLMNILGCLHPLSSGAYFFEGKDIGHVKDDFTLAFIRNKKMGFIFQQFNLISKLSALKNVALPAFYADTEKHIREARAQELLTSVGLGERSHHKPSELSGGQQQRVSIARSLVNDPEIILADEPTGALDSQTGAEILKLFSEFKARGKTVIMITHDAKVANMAERIIFMKDGRVLDPNYKLPYV